MNVSEVLSAMELEYTIRGDVEYFPDMTLATLDIECESDVLTENFLSDFHKAAKKLEKDKKDKEEKENLYLLLGHPFDHLKMMYFDIKEGVKDWMEVYGPIFELIGKDTNFYD